MRKHTKSDSQKDEEQAGTKIEVASVDKASEPVIVRQEQDIDQLKSMSAEDAFAMVEEEMSNRMKPTVH